MWGGWLLLEFLVLSFQQGIQHSYYTSAMAPPIAALTGIGAVAFYQAYRRRSGWESAAAAGDRGHRRMVVCAAAPHAELEPVAVLDGSRGDGGGGAGPGLRVAARPLPRRGQAEPRLLVVSGVAGLIAVLAGPPRTR